MNNSLNTPPIHYLDKVIYIASVGYSGSTLLDMILGSQDDITSLGEVALLARYARDRAKCTCGEAVGDCQFWNQVEAELSKQQEKEISLKNFELTPEEVKQSIFRKLPTLTDLSLVLGNQLIWKLAHKFNNRAKLFRQSALNAINVFDIACKVDQTRIIIDSSKYALPLKSLYMELQDKFSVVFLVRDGRAVCKSLMKRQSISMEQAAKKWARYNQNLKLVMSSIPKNQIYNLSYERLCLETETVLKELSDYIGTSDPIKIKPLLKDKFHDIGGNPMRYRRNETEIKYNDNWKSSITEEELRIFEQYAGKINRSLGYD
ncbi:MAG: sulfotransferase [Gammaproteobacteria bacterium]|nr:sulfotransferase [Gammaproteobacteria bacterium]